MEFKKLNTTTTSPQNITLLDSKGQAYDLESTFTIDSNKCIKDVYIKMVNLNHHKHEIKSAFLCPNTIDENNTFFYLIINMEKGTHQQEITIKPNLKFNKGDLIFVDSHEYDPNATPKGEEIKCGDIEIFDYNLNPEHKKGNILVGNP